MRGRGRLLKQDPLFLESFFFHSASSSNLASAHAVFKTMRETSWKEPIRSRRIYIIVKKVYNFRKLPSVKSVHLVCCFLVCDFMCWILSDKQRQQLGKRKQNRNNTTSYSGKWIHNLGGTVLTKDNAQTIFRGHSKTPNCLVLLKDDKNLVKGTMTVEERLQNRVAGNESTTDLETSGTGQKPNGRAGKKTVNCQQPVPLICW